MLMERLQEGGEGLLLKQSASAELLNAIHTVMNHRLYISPEVSADVRESIEHPWVRPEGFEVSLTPRQQEVLEMFANGISPNTIATTMGITVETVEFHKAGIMKTLGLKTASDLTRFALGQGLTQL